MSLEKITCWSQSPLEQKFFAELFFKKATAYLEI